MPARTLRETVTPLGAFRLGPVISLSTQSPKRSGRSYRRRMVEIKIRVPEDVHHAMKLTAQRQNTSVSDVGRTGILSYVSFDAARAGDEASWALGELFDAAARAVAVWPI